MRLVFLIALLAASASAQTPDSLATRRHTVPVVRILAGATVSLGLPVLVYYASSGEGEAAAAVAVVAIPLTAALGAHYVGTDGGGDFGRTLVGAGIGTLAGAAVLAIGGAVSASGVCGEFCFLPLAPGAVALLLGPAIGAGLRYRGGGAPDVQPVVLVSPDGARTAGLALHVAF